MSEIDEKTSRLQQMLASNGLDGVVLNAQHNFAWLTAGGANGVDHSRENGVASLLVSREGKRFVLANSIEMPRMLAEEVSKDDFTPIEYSWQEEKADPGIVFERSKKLLGSSINLATDILTGPNVSPIEGKVAMCRYSLTSSERVRYRDLGRDSAAGMKMATARVEQDDSEIQIAEKLRHELAVFGITSVVTLVAVDERISIFRHPIPTTKKLDKTALLVTCAKRHGLIVSLSRMVSFGKPSAELKARTEATAAVNAAFWHASKPGTSSAELYQEGARAYERLGFANEIDRHHQGGAAGYKTRDWVAHPAGTDVVQVDQAFAWNPSIRGTKVEETCIVGEGGIEVLTQSSDVPYVETKIEGQIYHSPGIIIQ